MTVDTRTGVITEPGSDLVPADNMAALDALDPADREIAVTRMLTEAQSWLAHAVESTSPASIAHFRAWAASVAETTRQLDLSKGIRLDAEEMVRRAERGLGVAIRKGQEAGAIAANGQRLARGLPHEKSSPADYFSGGGETSDVYALTDGISDEAFDEALTAAKAEENVSRANVVRKIKKDIPPPQPRSNGRPDVLRGTHRLDSNRIVSQAVADAAHLDAMVAEIVYADLDRNNLGEWINSLSESIKGLQSLKRNLERELSR